MIMFFILKLLDCTFGTLKNIFLFKNKHFWSALVYTVSTYFYLTMMITLTENDSILAKLIICSATFIGTYLPSKFIYKLDNRHDKLYIFDITSIDMASGKLFADDIRKRDIAIKSYKAYDSEMNKVLCCKIYCETKKESKIIKELIPKGFKYNAYMPEDTE